MEGETAGLLRGNGGNYGVVADSCGMRRLAQQKHPAQTLALKIRVDINGILYGAGKGFALTKWGNATPCGDLIVQFYYHHRVPGLIPPGEPRVAGPSSFRAGLIRSSGS